MGGCRANGGVLCGSWDILQVSFCWPWGGGEQSGRRRRSSPLRKRHDKQSSKEQTRRVTDSDTVISTARLTAIFPDTYRTGVSLIFRIHRCVE